MTSVGVCTLTLGVLLVVLHGEIIELLGQEALLEPHRARLAPLPVCSLYSLVYQQNVINQPSAHLFRCSSNILSSQEPLFSAFLGSRLKGLAFLKICKASDVFSLCPVSCLPYVRFIFIAPLQLFVKTVILRRC